MRIGIMLRAMDERQGIGIYSQNLMDELLALDHHNEYILFYRNPALLGRYAAHDHVQEIAIPSISKALWDQVRIPPHVRRHKVDLLFHTKFTLPLSVRCKTVMTIHGASWFAHPELYGKLDVAYIRTFMPFYCRKADAILANSDLTRNDFVRFLNVPPEKIYTTRLGTNPEFRPIDDAAALDAARTEYRLPDKFILSVIKRDPRKNFKNLIAAFRLLRKRIPCKLVVVGIGCEKYREEYDLDRDGTADDVLFLGWMDPAKLPLLYNLAHCLFFPSVYEEFGIPTCEAMACGCPPVVSKTGALPEVAGEAGLLVDPFAPPEMADTLERIWGDDGLRSEHSRRCLQRAREFTWRRCAEKTLDVLKGMA